MMTLAFDGWAECRLATDPDPSDEPRGVSGWTFALAGEPDLDRIIRLQPEHAVGRVPGPTLGVNVRAVFVDGEPIEQHPLAAATVDLLDSPVFEGRNGIAARAVLEPIVPFHLAVRGADDVLLRREHRALDTGELIVDPPAGIVEAGEDIGAALEGRSPAEFRAARRASLEDLLARTTDPVGSVALEKRIKDIAEDVGDGIAERILVGFALRYRIIMQGPWGEVRDPGGALGGTIDLTPWIADLWFGAFDADTLCMYVKGQIELPFRPAP